MRQIHAERGLVSLGLPICDFGVAGDRVFCNWFEFQPLRAVDQEHEKAKFKDGLGGDGQDSVAYRHSAPSFVGIFNFLNREKNIFSFLQTCA